MVSRKFIASLLALICVTAALPDDSRFIELYDAGRYEDAARRIHELVMTNAGVARRLGVMYYNGNGVIADRDKGCAMLEQAMHAGDAIASINLAKIYLKRDNNKPKAAWCLMMAEKSGCESIEEDVARLRGFFGEDYPTAVSSYVVQLRDLLENERTALKLKTQELDRERVELSRQIAENQVALKAKEEELSRCREEILFNKKEYEGSLAASNAVVIAAEKRCDALSSELSFVTKKTGELHKTEVELSEIKKALLLREDELKKLKAAYEVVAAESKRDKEALAGADSKLQEAKKSYDSLLARYEAMEVDHEAMKAKFNKLCAEAPLNKRKQILGKDEADLKIENLREKAEKTFEFFGGGAEASYSVAVEIADFVLSHGKAIAEDDMVDLKNIMLRLLSRAETDGMGEAAYMLWEVYGGGSDKYHALVSNDSKVQGKHFRVALELGNYSAMAKYVFSEMADLEKRYGSDPLYSSNLQVKKVCKYGRMMVEHDKATGDDLYRFAVWLDHNYVEKYHGEALNCFRRAARLGSVRAKKWLVLNGYTFEE